MLIDTRVRSGTSGWQLNFRERQLQHLLSKEFRCFMAAIKMHSGELATRSTVWVALTLYVASELFGALRRERGLAMVSWWLKAAGCVFFLGHIVFAFYHFYHWSHATAYAETARQSKELTGWNSGAGLYFNYIFALVWVSEVIWARMTPVGRLTRMTFWSWTSRGFFLFMIFNGAFVFVRGNIRWFGLGLCLFLVLSLWLRMKAGVDGGAAPKSS
jgi:hypothetical protein